MASILRPSCSAASASGGMSGFASMALQVARELRRVRPAIVASVDVRNRQPRELLLRKILEAADVHADILPIGVSLPTPKARTPQRLQKKCWFFRVLKRYSVRSDSPEIEQLHRYVA